MRAWRGHPGEEKVWHMHDAILLCIGHNTGSEKLVRAARGWLSRRVASGTRCMLKPLPCIAYRKKNVGQFSAPYVWRRSWARRRLHFLIQRKEERIVRYAREHNLGKIISVARPRAAGGVGKRLLTDSRIAPDLDQVLVALDERRPHD
ncbi:hypothetical protein ACNKHX_03805 [Shigella flexneri]